MDVDETAVGVCADRCWVWLPLGEWCGCRSAVSVVAARRGVWLPIGERCDKRWCSSVGVRKQCGGECCLGSFNVVRFIDSADGVTFFFRMGINLFYRPEGMC